MLGIGGCVSAIAFSGIAKQQYIKYKIQSLDNPKRKFTVVGKVPLKDRAVAKGIIYGAFPQATAQQFSQDSQLQSSFIQECNLLVSGFYWSITRPSPTTFDFSSTDYFANFAAKNNLLLRGHPLLWHKALPAWFESTLNHQNAEQLLVEHIQTIVKRYAGKIHSWDVVNEAVQPNDGRSDGLRKSPWLEFLGADYLDLAFRVAAQADPHTLLVYNGDLLEYDTNASQANRSAVLQLLEGLKSKGTPVHALGIQSHLYADEIRFNPQKFRNFLGNVASLGLKILVTELDVVDQNLPFNPVVRDRIVAATYEDYLNVVLDEPAVISVINWGLSDRYTWLSDSEPRPDNAPVRPLPLDNQMQRKLAWNAISRAIDYAPTRKMT
jgi:endo-1,4-beta-xylanase